MNPWDISNWREAVNRTLFERGDGSVNVAFYLFTSESDSRFVRNVLLRKLQSSKMLLSHNYELAEM